MKKAQKKAVWKAKERQWKTNVKDQWKWKAKDRQCRTSERSREPSHAGPALPRTRRLGCHVFGGEFGRGGGRGGVCVRAGGRGLDHPRHRGMQRIAVVAMGGERESGTRRLSSFPLGQRGHNAHGARSL